jgi:hypothetical protein
LDWIKSLANTTEIDRLVCSKIIGNGVKNASRGGKMAEDGEKIWVAANSGGISTEVRIAAYQHQLDSEDLSDNEISDLTNDSMFL